MTNDQMKSALDEAGVEYPGKATKDDLLALMKEHDIEVSEEASTKASKEIKGDPELVKLKIKAGLDKDQAHEVALNQAKHDAAQK